MAEFIVLDKQGRMVLPKSIRREIGATAFSARVADRKLVLEPLLSLDELVGCAPNVNRKRLLAEHEAEVKREDSS